MADYYATLGVARSATDQEIRRAYRRLARTCHPDLHPNDPAAEARFKQIGEAYEVLSDPQKRQKYDRFGANWQQADRFAYAGQTMNGPRRSAAASSTVEDAFGRDSLFGSLFRSNTRRSARPRSGPVRGPVRGDDLDRPVRVTFEEAYTGATRTLQFEGVEGCPDCQATGEVRYRRCTRCGGTGTLIRSRRLEVKVPPGVQTGSRIRIPGEGRPGSNGGIRGDLYLVVTVEADSRFERRGDDLQVEVPVKLTDAVLGGEVEVPTPGPRLALRLPAGTQNGQVFRLTAQGMPKLNGQGRGDLYAKVAVTLPSDLSDRQRALFEELRRLETPLSRS